MGTARQAVERSDYKCRVGVDVCRACAVQPARAVDVNMDVRLLVLKMVVSMEAPAQCGADTPAPTSDPRTKNFCRMLCECSCCAPGLVPVPKVSC